MAENIAMTFINKKENTEAVFTRIFETNFWGGDKSISGPGSNLEQTTVIRNCFTSVLKKYNITTILDIPCGDFYWMSHVDLHGFHYIGADIVQQLIQRNRRFSSKNVEFRHLNLICDSLPKVDLIFCRDLLVHLSFSDIFSALDNIFASGSDYLLTTTFVERSENSDIETGGWRPINLERMPFNFPAPIEILSEQCSQHQGQYRDKSLGLWRLIDLHRVLEERRTRINMVLFGDGQGWIVDRIIKRLFEEFSMRCNVSLHSYTKVTPDKFINICNAHDVVYYGNWDILRFINVLNLIEKPIIMSIRSFRYPQRIVYIAKKLAGLHIINPSLMRDFPNACYIPDGISDEYLNRDFIVGFSAQATPGNLDYKGYFLVKQACKELGVKFFPALGDFPANYMPQYYKSLDLFVCASENEGFGAPIIECITMGIPVVSTRVGVVCELSGMPGVTLVNRNVCSIKEAIIAYLKNKERLINYSWPTVAAKLFDFIISVRSAYNKQSFHEKI